MDESERRQYLSDLRSRMDEGFFFREEIVSKIVEDIAPVLNDCMEGELSFR